MPISDDQLNRILQQQQAQLDAQMRLLETLTQQLNIHCSSSYAVSSTSCDAVASSIPEFYYDPENGNTFLMWFKRWEDIFRIEFCKQDDAWKTRLLTRKLGSNEYARFTDHILPKLPRELSFEETVAQLSEIFGESSSLFSIRYQCLNLVKRETDEYGALADIVNRECERFKLRSLTEDQFKFLIFIKALPSPQDAEIRTRLLTRLDQDPNITLRTLIDECKRLQNIKHDNQLIEQVNPNLTYSSVNAITRLKAQKPRTSDSKPTTACWLCGDWHYVRFCPFKKHKCQMCKERGHKENHCPPNRTSQPKKKHKRPRHMVKPIESQSLSLVAAFQTDHNIRRKYVTIQINGISARLQIDTASDITLVSRETYNLLGNPPIKPSKKTARNASGGVLKLVGELQCGFSFNGNSCKAICYLTERPYLDLLGLDMLEKLGIMDMPINSVCNVSCPSLDTPIHAQEDKVVIWLQCKDPTVFRGGGHRKHKPVQRLQVNPNTRSYGSFQRGGVGTRRA
uniref:Gap-Pol polyprotein n=1 Tax=Schistosoma japonicum TaxID=6182 RepID=C7C1Z2_SCHJA|nr:Gap-Pol polyprotein [Schistosoma japonicum]